MNNYEPSIDEFEQYENRFDPMQTNRQARRKRKPKVRHIPKKSQHEIVNEIADLTGLEGGFQTTYKLTLYEEEFLLDSVRTFYEQSMITDILAQVKGGKEASVYRCQAHEVTGQDLLAVKVYRPRKFRQLRNDKMYREGRKVLSANGKKIQERDQRMARAIGNKSAFGAQLEHTSWLMHEYTTLQSLYAAGAAVPQPFASGHNALLIEYIGDEHRAAPTLNTVNLEIDEAQDLFEETIRNIELMLQQGYIHGDLSAYNILYWQGKITLIDFPQVTNIESNSHAYTILQRDVQRVCEYFIRQGADCDAAEIIEGFWEQYGRELEAPPEPESGF